MRALRPLLALAVLAAAAPALADDLYLGTIVSAGTSVTNLTTATSFKLYAKTRVSVQPDAAVYVVASCADTGSGTAATSSNGVKLAADQLFDIALGQSGSCTNYQIAIIPVSGSANVKVFQSL